VKFKFEKANSIIIFVELVVMSMDPPCKGRPADCRHETPMGLYTRLK